VKTVYRCFSLLQTPFLIGANFQQRRINMNLALSTSKETITSFELYKIINQCREVAGEKKVRVNDFTSRIADELDGEHYETFVVKNPNKTETTAYRLTHEQCMLIGMRESKAVRRSVIEKIKQLQNKNNFQIPQTLSEALQLAADQAKQLEIQAPKVAVYEMLADRKGDVSTTIVAKELGTTAIKLNRFLRDNGVKWQKADLPKAGYETWFNVVADTKNGHEFTQCLVTPDGQIGIAKMWAAI
jgi:phage antirepressor YoqD-like protein